MTFAYGTLSLTGTNASINYFSVSARTWPPATYANLGPVGATVFINVNGVTDQFSNANIPISGTTADKVLFNFYQATSLTLSGIDFNASLLAPTATLFGSGGHTDGNVMVAGISVNNGFEYHDTALFDGNSPVLPVVISTTANPITVSLGNTTPPILTDSATLTGGYSPTGTLTFYLYAPGGTAPVDTENVSISGDGTYSTPVGYTLPSSGTVAGTYQWVASYSGDTINKPVSTTKGQEPVAVNPASPSISTTANPTSITLSSNAAPPLKDSATLSGGFHDTGTITFTLYAPSGTAVDTETVTVSGNGSYSTPTGYTLPTAGTVTGTYQWVASYSGDANNNSVATQKGAEPVSVGAASPTISTTPNPTGVVLSASGPPKLTDSATLSGGYHETGNIIFTLDAPNGTTSTPRLSRSAATAPTARPPVTPCRPPAP